LAAQPFDLLAAEAALQPGQMLLAVSSVGLNFRDVLNVLDMYPGDPGAGRPGGAHKLAHKHVSTSAHKTCGAALIESLFACLAVFHCSPKAGIVHPQVNEVSSRLQQQHER